MNRKVRLYVEVATDLGAVDLGPYFFRTVRAARAWLRSQRVSRVQRWAIWKGDEMMENGP